MVDLLSILPFYIGFFVDLRSLQLIRLSGPDHPEALSLLRLACAVIRRTDRPQKDRPRDGFTQDRSYALQTAPQQLGRGSVPQKNPDGRYPSGRLPPG